MTNTRISRTAIHLTGTLMTAVLAFGALTSTPAHAATVGSTSQSTITKITAPGQPKFGDQGATVVALQSAILANGFSLKGGATGKFNTVTRRALRNFQKVVGLRVTGVVDEATVVVLKLAVAPATTTTVAPATTTTVAPASVLLAVIPKRGGKGKSVLTVQTALISAGVTVRGGTDGVFGSSTAEAISLFQKSKGLAVTATLTPDTVSALGLSVTTTTTVAPATTTTVAPASVLLAVIPKRGGKGKSVLTVQTALISAGVTVRGGTDGVFGSST
ncbi:MAG: peptidoglycan-binding protein, partial [Ilumatobacteraceae bacterium]|nr:peptidoglycan-binding protein [Ilumatobacteraceae bacterium]